MDQKITIMAEQKFFAEQVSNMMVNYIKVFGDSEDTISYGAYMLFVIVGKTIAESEGPEKVKEYVGEILQTAQAPEKA